ncbi:GntR family transcriptional regulator [Virgisporangium ochraceum]|uniref:GntR family transcriptional regulator n=1 Tax=Virgisporangium ochraceum TaxID=65505 RepID=A0A8J4E919_9ACTN|nr:GntR family transcriptional regulator [Virgisporangium ochraceum]GIJ66296.1 GntR family transcriptional regulator [Virgisporangium ochraceum]
MEQATRLDALPPKYVGIINAIQSRIENGTYEPEAMLPSEAALTREFGVARPTLVRALNYLRQHGWIKSRQGLGRFVLGVPTVDRRHSTCHGLALFNKSETARPTEILAAGTVAAPRSVAAPLGVPTGTPIVVRRRLVRSATGDPVELGTLFAPTEVAVGTGLGDKRLIDESLMRRLRHLPIDRVSQHVTARRPSANEARLLATGSKECLLVIVMLLRVRTGRALVGAEFLLPARLGLDENFPAS